MRFSFKNCSIRGILYLVVIIKTFLRKALRCYLVLFSSCMRWLFILLVNEVYLLLIHLILILKIKIHHASIIKVLNCLLSLFLVILSYTSRSFIIVTCSYYNTWGITTLGFISILWLFFLSDSYIVLEF